MLRYLTEIVNVYLEEVLYEMAKDENPVSDSRDEERVVNGDLGFVGNGG